MNKNAQSQFVEEVRRMIKKQRLMIKQVALSVKPPMDPGTLSRVLKGTRKQSQSLYTVQRVADALGCEVVLRLRERKT
jgi:hypothetical protein